MFPSKNFQKQITVLFLLDILQRMPTSIKQNKAVIPLFITKINFCKASLPHLLQEQNWVNKRLHEKQYNLKSNNEN